MSAIDDYLSDTPSTLAMSLCRAARAELAALRERVAALERKVEAGDRVEIVAQSLGWILVRERLADQFQATMRELQQATAAYRGAK